ncbi:hypothetical protein SS50377_21161 [Spironucleus salmonicida]|nr:hypothetical protein SS50377_21161 [Spironucleus salmonicida]
MQGFYECHKLESSINILQIQKIQLQAQIPFDFEVAPDLTKRVRRLEDPEVEVDYSTLLSNFIKEIKSLQAASIQYTETIRQIKINQKIALQLTNTIQDDSMIAELHDQFNQQIILVQSISIAQTCPQSDQILMKSPKKHTDRPSNSLREEELVDFDKKQLIQKVLFGQSARSMYSPVRTDSPLSLPILDQDQFAFE